MMVNQCASPTGQLPAPTKLVAFYTNNQGKRVFMIGWCDVEATNRTMKNASQKKTPVNYLLLLFIIKFGK